MDVLTDDHEREQVVRKWWAEYWKPIALGVVIALGGLLGYRQYQSYQLEQSQAQAYALYQLQSKLAMNNSTAQSDAENFIREHEDIYGALLALDLSAVQMAHGDYDKALANVKFAVAHGGDLIAPNAALTQARILAQIGKYDEAQNILKSIESQAYSIEIAETRGDIYLASGDKQKAHDAYKQALDLCVERKMPINPLLQMKFDDVIAQGDTPAFKIAVEHNNKLIAEGVQLHQY